jgi:hypothetical protein
MHHEPGIRGTVQYARIGLDGQQVTKTVGGDLVHAWDDSRDDVVHPYDHIESCIGVHDPKVMPRSLTGLDEAVIEDYD